MLFKKNLIKEVGAKFKSEYKTVLREIKRYDKIAVFRHIAPDFDALGTQFGLYFRLKENFPNKKIVALGDNHSVFTPRRLFPETDKIKDEWFNEPFLGILVDVGDQKRIADPRFMKASFKIKIDHHPTTDLIYDLMIVDTSKAAASEIVVNMLLNFGKRYKLFAKSARYFYTALAGDSGRFQYKSTTAHTFEIARRLIETGININEIYGLMYEKELKDLDVTKFILNNFKVSPKGVAYYVLKNSDLEALGLTTDRGKENVNMFANIDGINIRCSVTEDITEPCFRISIRSRKYKVNGVAAMFKGGGHDQASGAQIKDLSELPSFIAALESLIPDEK
jgi:phosphoesterase RecJ-like protein